MTDELIVLGSSSGTPTKNRFPSAYALRAAGKLFLIDCGAPVSTLLYQYGFEPFDVEAVFLSHWHLDHVAGLGLFLTQNRKRSTPLALYGPKGTWSKTQDLLINSFVLPERLGYELNINNIKPGRKYKESLIEVEYFKTQHLERTKYKTNFGPKAIACGMVINGPGWRIVYSGDLRSPVELAPYMADCTLLIHEMAHVTPEELAEFAIATNVPRLLISHLAAEYDEAPEKIAAAFEGRYQGELIIAQDGTRVTL